MDGTEIIVTACIVELTEVRMKEKIMSHCEMEIILLNNTSHSLRENDDTFTGTIQK